MSDIANSHEHKSQDSDINAVRASLIIPLIITVFCACLDMLCQIKNELFLFENYQNTIFWILGTLISYFFPSFFSAAILLLWQYYFAKSWSGLKKGIGLKLLGATIFFFFFYIVYLLFAKTWYIYCFTVINIIYACFVAGKCIDHVILQPSSETPRNNVNRSPSAKRNDVVKNPK